MIDCARAQLESGLCRLPARMPAGGPGALISQHHTAAVLELSVKLAVTIIAVCAGIVILWNSHQLQVAVRMCGRGDHSMCTPLSPWCMRRS